MNFKQVNFTSGMVDVITKREDMKNTLHTILSNLTQQGKMEFEFEKEIIEIEKQRNYKNSPKKRYDLSGEIEKFKATRNEKLKQYIKI